MICKKNLGFVVSFFCIVCAAQLTFARPAVEPADEYFHEGLKAYEKRDYSQALMLCKQCLHKERDSFNCSLLLAEVYWGRHKDAAAIKYLKKASRINPQDSRPWVSLGNIYAQKRKFKQAIVYFEKAAKLTPEDALAYSGLGECYFRLHDNSKAIFYADKAVTCDPRDTNARYFLGRALVEADDQMGALEQYNILLTLDAKLAADLLPRIKYKNFHAVR
jgi:tetratricopeptide (TPR) repeat protein